MNWIEFAALCFAMLSKMNTWKCYQSYLYIHFKIEASVPPCHTDWVLPSKKHRSELESGHFPFRLSQNASLQTSTNFLSHIFPVSYLSEDGNGEWQSGHDMMYSKNWGECFCKCTFYLNVMKSEINSYWNDQKCSHWQTIVFSHSIPSHSTIFTYSKCILVSWATPPAPTCVCKC